MYPESGCFHQGSGQGPHDYPGRHFGGGPQAGHQQGCKRPLNRQVKPQHDGQKRKWMLTAGEEPESRMNKTEAAWAEATEDAGAGEEKTSLTETNPAADVEQDIPGKRKAKASPQGTQTLGQVRGKPSNLKKRRGLLERSGAKIDTF
ncbi:hypothetical protein NHX12_022074 [Muraenolepis orangiensis]|uniref:Uncharacterized protein n=1 Tax=Muraenolepis orangiensis TaxID=630683 RepID=A0A9Q0EQW8_9TELE|nr:hypothetical protein NHX12_022074 [Muraenolepis orangiensis]